MRPEPQRLRAEERQRERRAEDEDGEQAADRDGQPAEQMRDCALSSVGRSTDARRPTGEDAAEAVESSAVALAASSLPTTCGDPGVNSPAAHLTSALAIRSLSGDDPRGTDVGTAAAVDAAAAVATDESAVARGAAITSCKHASARCAASRDDSRSLVRSNKAVEMERRSGRVVRPGISAGGVQRDAPSRAGSVA